MKAATILSGLSLFVLATAMFLFFRIPNRGDNAAKAGQFGFREILKDSAKRDALFAMANPGDVGAMSEEEITKAVDGYVHSQGQSPEYWIVQELGPRAVPALLRTLSRADATGIPEPSGMMPPDAPIQRALSMLRPYARTETIPFLLPLIAHDNYHMRADAGLMLASLGGDEVIDPVMEVLSDPEGHVRSLTCIGIGEALTKNRATSRYRAALFAPLAAELEKPFEPNSPYPVDLLMKLDPTRAAALLNTPKFLRDTGSRTGEVLRALRRQKIVVEEKLLWDLIASHPPTVKSDAGTDSYCAALLTLAAQNAPGVDQLITSALAEKPMPEEAGLDHYARARIERQEAAALALWIQADLPDPSLVAWKSYEDAGDDFTRIPESHRDILFATILDGEVCNGGFDQYYFNSSGDFAAETLAALRRIGDTDRAEILRSSMEIFGSKGPSRDREKRNLQLEKLSEEQSSRLSELDNAWYNSQGSLSVKIYSYCLIKKTDFARGGSLASSEPQY